MSRSPAGRTAWLAASIAAASLGLFGAPAASAQQPFPYPNPSPEPVDTVVVTATRSAQPLSQVLADVSVIDRGAIDRSGAASLADLLARLPGIEFARNGGPGTATSVYVRGSESRHTALYIDGLRVDSQSTGGAAWEQVSLDQIERIEVLRGPAAAVYGSDAIGGVVQLFTKRGQGVLRPTASLGVGSFRTTQAQAGVSGAAGAIDYALSASQGRSDGFNARVAPTANPDDDGYERSGLQARLGWQAEPRQRVEANLLASRLQSQYDGSLKNDDIGRQRLQVAGLTWSGQWAPDSASKAQAGETRSTYETAPSFYSTETTLRNLVLQHQQTVAGQRLSVTLERREDRLHNAATASGPALDGARTQDALALGWSTDLGQHALQVHARHDDDSEFGGQATGSLAWGWRFAPAWRASASAATSFRAPTLYQRFSEYGVAGLVPETGRNLELGLRWAAAGHALSATAWRNRVDELIVFGAAGPCASTFGCYANVGRARYEGLTLAGSTRLGGVALRGSVDWHDPRNLDTGLVLARRARQLATLGADGDGSGWQWGVELQATGERFDNAANTQRLAGYALLNLRVARTLAPGWQLQARIDNLTDTDYQLARTYATAGRSLQLTLRWAP